MHQYKTMAQTLLVLSILNLVFGGPVVLPSEASDTGNYVPVAAKDVTTVSERWRRDTPPGGTTPSQYSSSSSSSSDGSPPHDSSPLDESALLQGSTPSSHLSPTDEQVSMHGSITEPLTFAHPLSAADGPAAVPDSAVTEPSTSTHLLSAVDGTAPAPDSISEASTSSHHSSATNRPVPQHDSTAEGSTTPHYTAVTLDMLGKDPPIPPSESDKFATVKKVAGMSLLAGVAATILFFAVWDNKSKND